MAYEIEVFVRSNDHLARHSDGATGLKLTRQQVIETFGKAIIDEVDGKGCAIIAPELIGDFVHSCPSCGGYATYTEQKQEFPYGCKENQVVLTAMVPVTSCIRCGEFTNCVGEDRRQAAVERHLEGLSKKLSKLPSPSKMTILLTAINLLIPIGLAFLLPLPMHTIALGVYAIFAWEVAMTLCYVRR